MAEAIAAEETFVADGKKLDFAIFVAADSGSTRTKSLLQDAFGDAVVFMDGHGVSPGRTTVEGNAEALAENYVLSTCAEILPHGRDSAFRSIAAARAAFEQGWTANRSRRFHRRGKHAAASGAPAACVPTAESRPRREKGKSFKKINLRERKRTKALSRPAGRGGRVAADRSPIEVVDPQYHCDRGRTWRKPRTPTQIKSRPYSHPALLR